MSTGVAGVGLESRLDAHLGKRRGALGIVRQGHSYIKATASFSSSITALQSLSHPFSFCSSQMRLSAAMSSWYPLSLIHI